MEEPILQIEDLHVYFETVVGDAKSVEGVSLSIYPNEIFGIAGESGCGKSTLVDGILRLVKPPGYVPKGRVMFKGVDLLKLSQEEMRGLRWEEISYIPQGSMNSLNPVLRIEEQMRDAVLAHVKVPKQEAREMAVSALMKVGLPADVLRMYAHELSGGMKQRVIIAMSLLLQPSLVIADEPVTALDVVAQKAVLQSVARLRDDYGMTIIFVAHDMAAHAEIADRVAIMYAGHVAEISSVNDLFLDPLHPYAEMLIASIPSVDKETVEGIPGLAPNALDWPSGCRFHPRCPVAIDICPEEDPELIPIRDGRHAACHLVRPNHDAAAVATEGRPQRI
jgi:peptide/nickel transport system ATP-binding protein